MLPHPERFQIDFPILSRVTNSGAALAFLDNAASTQRPDAVLQAMDRCYREYYANVHRGIHTLSEASTEAYEQAREETRRFLNARSRCEIVFTAGATAAINAVARCWGDQNIGPDDVILLTIAEHHANIVPWHQLASRVGCRIEFVPLEDDFTIDTQRVSQMLAELRPKLFAFTATSNVLGTDFPVQQWGELARAVGAVTLVDAAQAVPHRKIDVQQWNSDFVVFSGHKVCGPTGIGVLYGKETLLDEMPPFLGGGAMIDTVTTSGFTTASLPDKFEAGTPPIVEAIGLAEAIRYVSAIGMDNIHEHERQLTVQADEGLRAIDGVSIVGPRPDQKSGIVSFTVEGVHAHDVAQWLDTRGIAVRAGHHCTMPLHASLGISATARASFYFYNRADEVDRLIAAVHEVREKFASRGRRRRKPASPLS
ncbi:SufS family cysteine desulfurase [Stieleria varia]|uniref:cysteine desulfurase n=1 Tax=Stieleria varia TaxID=2528005 RepID=A0A5C6AUN7_9BACT|nr:SufS family cysteine desulfurase [Stieleria varia]TWU02732.1 putative cysteine desulfurase [Stieleria varia]